VLVNQYFASQSAMLTLHQHPCCDGHRVHHRHVHHHVHHVHDLRKVHAEDVHLSCVNRRSTENHLEIPTFNTFFGRLVLISCTASISVTESYSWKESVHDTTFVSVKTAGILTLFVSYWVRASLPSFCRCPKKKVLHTTLVARVVTTSTATATTSTASSTS